LKVWDVDRLVREMPLKLFYEWVAFFKLEDEEAKKALLEDEAKREIEKMRGKRNKR
jgi:hypothetical protein